VGRRKTTGPTAAELEILCVLWQRRPATVRQVHAALNETKPTGYTTALKLMQIMVEKGLLLRDETVRPQVYRPAASKERTQGKLLHDLMQRAFDGSAAELVLRALATQRASPEELAAIRRAIDEM
jgi:BlaI family penicillinase repressor